LLPDTSLDLPTMTAERRKQRRFDVCLDATWNGMRGNSNVRVTDLSEGGCYLDTIAEARKGELVQLKVKLPGGDWLVLKAEVAHVFPRIGFGLRFIDLDNEQQSKLQSLLNDLKDSDELPPSQICA
jgi:hypothetical protein